MSLKRLHYVMLKNCISSKFDRNPDSPGSIQFYIFQIILVAHMHYSKFFFFFWHVHALLLAVRNAVISNVFVYIENSEISSILYHSLTGINITEPNELITYKERGNRYSRRRAQYTISKNNRRSDKPLMGMSVWKEMDKTRR